MPRKAPIQPTIIRPCFRSGSGEPFDIFKPTLPTAINFVQDVTVRCTKLGLCVEFEAATSELGDHLVTLLTTIQEPPSPMLERDIVIYMHSANLETIKDWLTAVETGVAFERRCLRRAQAESLAAS